MYIGLTGYQSNSSHGQLATQSSRHTVNLSVSHLRLSTQLTRHHGRKSRGEGGRVPQEFVVGTLIQIATRFCLVSKFQEPDCLQYNAVKVYQTHNSH